MCVFFFLATLVCESKIFRVCSEQSLSLLCRCQAASSRTPPELAPVTLPTVCCGCSSAASEQVGEERGKKNMDNAGIKSLNFRGL